LLNYYNYFYNVHEESQTYTPFITCIQLTNCTVVQYLNVRTHPQTMNR